MFCIQACTSSSLIIPEALESRVDKQLVFSKVIQNPDAYTGKWLLIGGEVLHTHSLHDRTRLEILQLPLNEWQQPQPQRSASHGRFLALHTAFVDPATIPSNTRVTLVGEMTGSERALLDEMEYQYPTLTIQHLHVWEHDTSTRSTHNKPRWSLFGGGGTGGRSGGGFSIGFGF
ncbi:MAG: hypothetical protein NPIRA02_21570 [Nitrospirales bacterium]|nr:MAG: hypothetical protein NPIRA02_21570 [Nitrospirales bacterium]